jgi:hypothetical protein
MRKFIFLLLVTVAISAVWAAPAANPTPRRWLRVLSGADRFSGEGWVNVDQVEAVSGGQPKYVAHTTTGRAFILAPGEWRP